MNQKAIIYCRVSSERQVKEGNGLQSQETRCRNHIKSKGYKYIRTFRDEGISGAKESREGFDEMLKFLASQTDSTVVVIDDIKRLARDVEVHLALRLKLRKYGGILESPSFEFSDSPEGKFVETLFAGTAQLEREQNRAQVINKQKARLENGYWPFFPPPGYITKRDPIHGKLLVFDEPNASIIKEALESYATDRFLTKSDVKDFMESKGYLSHSRLPVKLHITRVDKLLRRSVYAGYIEYPKWGVEIRKGHHEALISLETHQKILAKLDGKKYASYSMGQYNEDFPLRGFVKCRSCGKFFTASWCKGRNKKYPKYRCNNKFCVNYSKGIDKALIESEFKEILLRITPKQSVMNLVEAIVTDICNKKFEGVELSTKSKKEELKKIDMEISNYIQRIDKNIGNEDLVQVYEHKISEVQDRRKDLEMQISSMDYSRYDVGTAFNRVKSFIENPLNIWESESYKTKILVPELIFNKNLTYERNIGFGTGDLSLIMKVFNYSEGDKNQLVEMGGVEPPSKI